MAHFFHKYVPQHREVHHTNYRRTHLPKVGDSKRSDIERIIRKRHYYVVIFGDEIDDPRPDEQYQLAINVLLVPKEINSEIAGFCLFIWILNFFMR